MISVAVEGVAPAQLQDELVQALERAGAAVEVRARAGGGAVLAWRPAGWQPEEQAELELYADGARVVLELRGLEGLLGGELAGWVAELVAAATPGRLGDWLTDRHARRPSGAAARAGFRDPAYHRPSFGAVLAALEPGPDDVLLELGCGGGAFLQDALGRGCRAVGVDHSAEMVAVARELNAAAVAEGRLELVEADAAQLPFADARFTCAALLQVFFFLPDPAAVLAECARVLRPEGRLAVFTVSAEARGTPASPEPMASRSRYYEDEELAALALRAGFGDAVVTRPDLEPFARAAGLPEEVVPLFRGPGFGQLLLAVR